MIKTVLTIIGLSFLLLLSACKNSTPASQPYYTLIKIDDVLIKAETEKTPEQQELGLQYRQNLPENMGMLFVYAQPQLLSFWMKNMHFPLDMIWIDADNKIVDIMANIPPCKNEPCQVYTSAYKAKYVLEVNAGFAALHNLQPEMEVFFS